MNQIEAQIMGRSYRLSCPPEDEARLHQAVQKVDEAMCSIRDAGKIRARDRIAVLAALNIAFDTGTGAPAASAPGAVAPENSDDLAALQQMLAQLDAALNEDGRLV